MAPLHDASLVRGGQTAQGNPWAVSLFFEINSKQSFRVPDRCYTHMLCTSSSDPIERRHTELL